MGNQSTETSGRKNKHKRSKTKGHRKRAKRLREKDMQGAKNMREKGEL